MGPFGMFLAGCLWSLCPQDAQAAPQQPFSLGDLNRGLALHGRPTEALHLEKPDSLDELMVGWGGWREQLAQRGLALELLYVTDGSWAVEGGADPDGTALRSLLDLACYYDTAATLGWSGGMFHVDLQWSTGVNGSQRFGVLQPVSNIDADRRLQLARVWYEQIFQATDTRVRLGKIDANSLFAYVDNGARFQNGSMGFSPTILALPTYPDAAYGLACVQGLGAGFELRAGAFDGSGYAGVPTGLHGPASLWESPQDAFLIGELDCTWASALPGRAGIGVWSLDGELSRFDGGTQDSTGGVYAVLDQRLWNAQHDGERNLGTYLQLGLADAAVSPFTGHLGTGLVLEDAFSSLRNDFAGLGMTYAQLSDEAGAGFSASNETVIELFLGFEARPWLRVKPDLQYVINPGGDASLDNAWIATLRVTLGL